jgi:hypothetical protein
MHNASAGVNAQCLAERPTELAWQCATGKEAVRYLQHPAFLVNSDFDGYQMLSECAFNLAHKRATFIAFLVPRLKPLLNKQLHQPPPLFRPLCAALGTRRGPYVGGLYIKHQCLHRGAVECIGGAVDGALSWGPGGGRGLG